MEKTLYRIGKNVVNIPNDKKEDFLKDYPDAIESKGYVVGNDTLAIPINRENDFLKDMPQAKPLIANQSPQALPQQSEQSIIQQGFSNPNAFLQQVKEQKQVAQPQEQQFQLPTSPMANILHQQIQEDNTAQAQQAANKDLAKTEFETNLVGDKDLYYANKNITNKLNSNTATDEEKQMAEQLKPHIEAQKHDLDQKYVHWGLTNFSQTPQDIKIADLAAKYADAIQSTDPKIKSTAFDYLHDIKKINPEWQPNLQALNPQAQAQLKSIYQDQVVDYQAAKREYERAKAHLGGTAAQLAANIPLSNITNLSAEKNFKQAEERLRDASIALQAGYKAYVLKENIGGEQQTATQSPTIGLTPTDVSLNLLKGFGKFSATTLNTLASAIKGVSQKENGEYSPTYQQQPIVQQAQALKDAYATHSIESPKDLNEAVMPFASQAGKSAGEMSYMIAQTLPIAPLVELTAGGALGGDAAKIANDLIATKKFGNVVKGAAIKSAMGGATFTAATADPSQFKTGVEMELAGTLGNFMPKMIAENPYLNKLAGAGATVTGLEALHLGNAAVRYAATSDDFNTALEKAGISPNLSEESKNQLINLILFGGGAFMHGAEKKPLTMEEKSKLGDDLIKNGAKPEEVANLMNSIETEKIKIGEQPKSAKEQLAEIENEQPLEEKPTQTEVPTETKINEPINKTKNDIAKEIALSIQPSVGNEDYYLKNQQEIEKNPIEHLDRMINYLETKTIPEGKESNSALLDMHERKLDELKGLKEQYLKASEPIAKIEPPIPHTEDLEGAIKQTQSNIDNNINPILDERQQSDAANILSEKEPADDIESVRNQISKIEGLENSIAKGSEAANAAEGGSAAPKGIGGEAKGAESGVAETEINQLNNNKNEKGNEVREIEKGFGNEGGERKLSERPQGGQETNVQEEKVAQGEEIPPNALKDVESTAKALDDALKNNDDISDELEDLFLRENGNYKLPFRKIGQTLFFKEKGLTGKETKEQLIAKGIDIKKYQSEYDLFLKKNESKILSELYHKAKTDGSNPELVKAVEQLLTPKTKNNAINQKPIQESVSAERENGNKSQETDKTSVSDKLLGTEKGEEKISPEQAQKLIDAKKMPFSSYKAKYKDATMEEFQANRIANTKVSDWLRNQADDIANNKQTLSSLIPPHLIEKAFRLLADAIDKGVEIGKAIKDIAKQLHSEIGGKEEDIEKDLEKAYRNSLKPVDRIEQGESADNIIEDIKDKKIKFFEKKALKANPNLTPEEANKIANEKFNKYANLLKEHEQDVSRNLRKTAESFVRENKPLGEILSFLKAKGVDDETALSMAGHAIETVTSTETAASKEQSIAYYKKLQELTSGRKNLRRLVAENIGHFIQQDIKTSITEEQAKKKIGVRDINKAIHIFLDLKKNPEHYDQYYNDLTPKQKKIADLARNLSDKQKEIAEGIRSHYEKSYAEAKAAGLINSYIEDYAAHFWKGDNEMAYGDSKGKTTTMHGKQRVLDSILQGWANGKELAVEGASNNLSKYLTNIGKAIEFASLKDEALRMEYFTGETKEVENADGTTKQVPVKQKLFTTTPTKDSVKIESPNFKKWMKMEGTSLSDYEVSQHPDLMKTNDGAVLKGSEVYAPKEVAKTLNNILGRSKLNQYEFFRRLTTAFKAIKTSLLSYSGMHLVKFGIHNFNNTYENFNPIKAYHEGIEMARNPTPDVIDLVKGGLMLSTRGDYEETTNNEDTYLGKLLDKTNATKAVKDKIYEANKAFHHFLFDKVGTAFKTYDAVHLFQKELQKNPTADRNEVAKRVAKAVNDSYGGINWEIEHGAVMQNPTAKHIATLSMLAPDWTISKIRFAKKAFEKGDDGAVYRRMWGSILLKAGMATTLANLSSALFSDDDKEKKMGYGERLAERYGKAWDEKGAIGLTDIDWTPLYRYITGEKDKRAYISVFGAYTEPLKMIKKEGVEDLVQAVKDAKNKEIKASFKDLASASGNLFTGVKDFAYNKLSSPVKASVDAATGRTGKTDNARRYTDVDKLIWENGLNLTTWNNYDENNHAVQGSIKQKEIPSFVLSQLQGIIPIPIQASMQAAVGNKDWFETLNSFAGTGAEIKKEKGMPTEENQTQKHSHKFHHRSFLNELHFEK